MNKTKLIWHCLDTYAGMDVDVTDVDRWHRKRGFDCIGYAGIIKRDGTRQLGRDLDHDGDTSDEIGAHALGFNSTSIGWAYAGGRGENGQPQFNPTPAQLREMAAVTFELEDRFPGIEVMGHCDLPDVTKACPVFDVRAWHANLRKPQ